MTGLEIVAAVQGIEALANMIDKQIEIARQANELSADQELTIEVSRAKTFAKPYWKPSPE